MVFHNLLLSSGEFKTNCKKCECDKFKYIPIFPEETNEYAKAYLLDFNYDNWKAGCKCGHNWTKHDFNDGKKCEECKCECFESKFCCGVCGNPWEKHIILIQTKCFPSKLKVHIKVVIRRCIIIETKAPVTFSSTY